MGVVTIMIAVVLLNARSIAEFLEPNPQVVDEIINIYYICMIAEPFYCINLAMTGGIKWSRIQKLLCSMHIKCVDIKAATCIYFCIALGFHRSRYMVGFKLRFLFTVYLIN